jgi:hypothetical protein
MPTRFTTLTIGALALLTGGTAGAQAQETNTNAGDTIGNPQLKNFELPGTRTTPPPPPATVPPATTTPPATTPPETTAPDPAPRPAPRRQERAATPPPAEPAQRAAEPAPQPAETVTLPTPEDLERALPAPPIAAPPMAEAEPAPVRAPAPTPAASKGGVPWLPIALGVAALLALLAFLKLRGRRRTDEAVEEPQTAPEPAPAVAKQPAPAAPQPAPAAAPAGDIVAIQLRPWIELEFRPARAASTLTEANVQFELVVRNTGSAPARDLRVEVRMFNAGPTQEQEIEAFYAEPIRERTPPALPVLPPKSEVQVSSAVALPNEQVREVTIQGRRLFIPTVAFNVVYDYGQGKSGQTSASYLVGRETEPASGKMGGFRLDLGPRLYRSVGQRPTRLARAV